MCPYTLIQLGMHSDPSAGGVDRYFWGLNDAIGRASTGLETRAFFFDKGASKESSGAIGRADLPLRRRLGLLRSRFVGSPHYYPSRSVLASHFALYALAVLQLNSKLTHIVHFHGPWAEESSGEGALKERAKRMVEQAVYRTADAFITLSVAFRELLISKYNVASQKIHVVPGAVDTSQFGPRERAKARALLGWSQEQRIIFCIRRLVERMGLQALIAAFGAISAKYPDASLYIGGVGPIQGALESQIRAIGLVDRVRMLGFVSEPLLPAHYQAADFSIVPSQSLEGFGLTTIESLACGTPVVVTPVGGLTEVVRPLSPSCVLSGASSKEIAIGLDRALGGQIALPRARECVAYVQKRFTWDRVAREILGIYDEAFRIKHGRVKSRQEAVAA
jgi:glycosyltransferase involved in cell wall biosynthesis